MVRKRQVEDQAWLEQELEGSEFQDARLRNRFGVLLEQFWKGIVQAPCLSRSLVKLAQLGGYLARANDPPPGNKVIWRGMHRLMEIEIGYQLARRDSG
ncbi:transposase DNA-binding-containing protein [Paraburkholderia caribensis]|uniref:Transposase DNA-binding-containing protein n=1 Tax=Paraburkholderia caribensis TaxID=75105 RepID=A0ABV0E743_9BURK|nr:transposase DNA-binding-containing protein [Paraburkholderia caribensis]PTB24852.1 hypothetical protein C9I56_31595 [Paraburkholderia caribensis]